MAIPIFSNIVYRGSNAKGSLAVPTYSMLQSSIPVRIHLPGPVASVAPGRDFVVAVLTSGDVFTWGLNDFEQVRHKLFAETCPTQSLDFRSVRLKLQLMAISQMI